MTNQHSQISHLAQALKTRYNPNSALKLATLYQHTNHHHNAIELLYPLHLKYPKEPFISERLAISFSHTSQPKDAAHQFATTFKLNPKNTGTLHQAVIESYHANEWTLLERLEPILDNITQDQIAHGLPITQSPLTILYRTDDPKRCLNIAQQYSNRYHAPKTLKKNTHHPIHVAYLSADLRNHVIGYHLYQIFTHHDYSQFKITLLQNHPGDDSFVTKTINKSPAQLVDITNITDPQLIRNLNIDILIDLNGHTSGERLDLLQHRLAPIQINYLGFPGSTGTTFHDYILADNNLIPESHHSNYTEKCISLPHGYLPLSPPPLAPATTKSIHNLPKDKLVLASFNSSYKITKRIWSIWLELLKANPNTVLWLYSSNPDSKQTLSNIARQEGLANQVIHAPHLPFHEHAERLAHADLILDTFPYNGGSTTATALYSGVPVITIKGRHYPSRMGASMLHHLNMPDLITENHTQYAKTIQSLLTAKKLTKLKHILKSACAHPMFSPKSFTSQLESILLKIH